MITAMRIVTSAVRLSLSLSIFTGFAASVVVDVDDVVDVVDETCVVIGGSTVDPST